MAYMMFRLAVAFEEWKMTASPSKMSAEEILTVLGSDFINSPNSPTEVLIDGPIRRPFWVELESPESTFIKRGLISFVRHLTKTYDSSHHKTDIRAYIQDEALQRIESGAYRRRPGTDYLAQEDATNIIRQAVNWILKSKADRFNLTFDDPMGSITLRFLAGISDQPVHVNVFPAEMEAEESDSPLRWIQEDEYWVNRRFLTLLKYLLHPKAGENRLRLMTSKSGTPDKNVPTVMFADEPATICQFDTPITAFVPVNFTFTKRDWTPLARTSVITQFLNDEGASAAYALTILEKGSLAQKTVEVQIIDNGRAQKTARVPSENLCNRPIQAFFMDPSGELSTLHDIANIRVGAVRPESDKISIDELRNTDFLTANPVSRDTATIHSVHLGDIIIPATYYSPELVTLVTGPKGEVDGRPTSRCVTHNFIIIRLKPDHQGAWNQVFLWMQLRHGQLAQLIQSLTDRRFGRVLTRQIAHIPIINAPIRREQDILADQYLLVKTRMEAANRELDSVIAKLRS